jgi:uncharacterized protein (TIGR03435 family)
VPAPQQRRSALPVRSVTLAALIIIVQSWIGLAQQPAFEVASIKPGGPAGSLPPTMGPPGPGPTMGATTFSAHGKSLVWLIRTAYGVDQAQVSGGPSWVTSDPWDVDARAAAPATPEQMLGMLQTLLADRFQLRFHRDTKDVEWNVLTVAKGGPKFGKQFRVVSGDMPAAQRVKAAANQIGPAYMAMKVFAGFLQSNMSMDLATHHPLDTGPARPVLDRTDLPGTYAITIKTEGETDWSQLLERQLGLKVELRNVPTESIVIDSAAKPAGN